MKGGRKSKLQWPESEDESEEEESEEDQEEDSDDVSTLSREETTLTTTLGSGR
jgi:hypothetical protein